MIKVGMRVLVIGTNKVWEVTAVSAQSGSEALSVALVPAAKIGTTEQDRQIADEWVADRILEKTKGKLNFVKLGAKYGLKAHVVRKRLDAALEAGNYDVAKYQEWLDKKKEDQIAYSKRQYDWHLVRKEISLEEAEQSLKEDIERANSDRRYIAPGNKDRA